MDSQIVSQDHALGWGSLALINAGLAEAKGKGRLVWFFISLLLGPIATFLIVVQNRTAPNPAPSPGASAA